MTDTKFPSSELAAFDPVGWHYTEQLSHRARQVSGVTRALLQAKLDTALHTLQARFDAEKTKGLASKAIDRASPSPLAQLLQDITPAASRVSTTETGAWPDESPHMRQFRQQLGHIRVQKQVSQALAQGPQNAGPINSHMLVLRSLACMRDVSPDYLNRFMAYVDTLLCLEEATALKPSARKPAGAQSGQKPAVSKP
jgi:hypothetical protein